MGIIQQDILSLSPMQEAMLFHSLFDKGNSYFKQLVFRIEGDFSPQLFEKSLNKLIERYEIFRTVFLYKKVQKPRQVILKERKTEIRYEDFSHLPDEEKEQKISASIKQDQEKPFNLFKDVLLRVTVLKIGERQYQVIFSSHHILLDGWCLGIVFEDLFEIYGKLKHNEPVPVRKVTQYREFIRWLEKQNQSAARDYWKQVLSGYEEPVKIPGKKSVTDGEYRLGELTLSLDENLTRELNILARRHHLTLNNVFQTIWGILLGRYNNTDDVVFGSVVSGRNKPIRDIQKMLGLFINTIPVRVRGSGRERFIDLAKRVQQSALASEPYDYVSLADTQKSMQFGDQLFDHIVVFENYAFDPNVFDKYSDQLGFAITDARSTFDKTNYDFNVIVIPDEKLNILFQYNELAYSGTYVETLFGHFKHIVEQVIQQPETLLKELELVTETEKQQLLNGFNQTDADYPRNTTIQEIFEEQAEKYPQQIAVKIREEALTYKELNEQANQLARVLRKVGVKRGQIVGLMTERSLEMMIGMLGIIKAGGAYMPIDPEYPQDRKEFMLRDSQTSFLLLQTGLDVPSSYQGEIIHLLPEKWAGEERSNLSGVNQAEDLLYVIYTSGSTGKPKGNLTTHRNVMRTVINSGYIEINSNDRLLQLSNYCFDGSTFDIYNALLNGATLVLVPKEAGIDFTRLSQLIRDEEITVTFMTTSLFNTIVDLDLGCLQNLRKVVFGGEKASVKHVQKAVRALGEHRLVNGYGPTETTVFAATCSIGQSVLATHRVPIGKPLNNTRLYVLNRWGKLQPVGVPGELCISGDGVAKGYLNRPELNKTRFVSDPFCPGSRMYRSGDLARWLPDGNVEYIGRMDNQVKIRGNRIEIGEVELRLLSHPEVRNTVVVADKDENGHSYLSAYIVLEQDISLNELRDYMSETLPDYMIPDYFVKMDQLPLTPNGKVDKKALPKPAETRLNEQRYVKPTNPVEEKLAKIWQAVLDVDQISIHDDFFEIGGHSLKAMVLSSQVHKQFSVDLPLREIFARPTIHKQATYIQMSHQKEYTEISPAPEMEVYPVSSAQKRLYMVGQLEGMGTGYNMPYVFRVHGSLPVQQLEDALQTLIERHETLRTTFHLVEGELKQKIHPEAAIKIEYYQAKDEVQGKQVISRFIRTFDLGQAPLMRAGLLHQIDSEEMFLLMDFHHIVADGVSIRILFQDLTELMKGKKLPPLALQYKDYAFWQQNVQQKEEWMRHEKYWLNEFSGELPVLDLPIDYPRPAVQQFEGDHLAFQFDPIVSKKLKRFCDKQKATLYMVLLAAYNLLLSRYSGQKDLIVGSPVAGRPHADLQSIVGMFANTLAVRSKLNPNLTFAQFVGQMKEHILQMTEHQNYPFEELVEKLNIKRDLSRNPLFDTMFAMQNNDQSSLDFPDFSMKLAEWEWKKAKFDMSWIMIEDEKIHGIVEYATRLFKTETIQKMIQDYIHLVKQVVENPDNCLWEIELINPDEKQKILQTFNETKLEYPRGKTIQAWFEEQVAKRPEQVAVVYGKEQLSYRELNERANRLAHTLRKKGIGKEQIVGILMPASIDMMTAILGVLKAGAAYLPIDPGYPAERIQYMLEDSRAVLLLTNDQITVPPISTEQWNLNQMVFHDELWHNPAPLNGEHDLAYVIYTSGSTGKPKGVMVEHASLVNLCQWHVKEFEVTPADRCTKYAGVGFDASVWEIFPTWMAGASLYIIEEALRYDLDALNEYMEEKGITIAFLPTQVAEQFMQLENSSLRTLLVGGDRLQRVCPQSYAVVNNYGPTENTVVTTSTEVRTGEPITIGKPIANNQVYVLNEHQQLQPIGVPGELCVSGDSLARGYLHQRELTEEKFVQNPFVPGQRMYRTGDLVRWMPDGSLEFLGRIDDQVKIRGYRIELGEVTSRLLEHGSVQEAIVVTRQNRSGEPELCAYFVPSTTYNIVELRQYLEAKLPDYMIPAHFVKLEELPLTANGKVDKKALPAPENFAVIKSGYTPPANPAEKKLAKIWKDVLGQEQVGTDESFFERGGNSLKGMILSSKIHKHMGIDLPLREIFVRPTIRQQAAYIQQKDALQYVNIPVAPKQEYYPVSSAQKRLYVVGQLEGMGTSYNMPYVFHIHGDLSITSLENALQTLVERHESLRTSFHLIEGELKQKIHPEAKLVLEHYQARDRLESNRLIEQFIRPFNLEQAPLIRAGLINESKQEYILLIDLHHIISDGVSMNLLFQDLINLIKGEDLPPLVLQYKDYAVWQQNERKKDLWKQHEQYWIDELSGELPVLDLPTDYPRPPVQQFDGKHISFEIAPDLTRQLKKLVDEQKVTLYMVLLAAYNILLAKYTGKEDIIVGSPIAGRSHADLQSMVGMFANTLAVRNRPVSDLPFTAFLEQVKERVLSMYEHQDYPFEELVEKLDTERDLSRNPLFDTMFAMQNIEMPTFELPGLTIRQGEFSWNKAKFDMSWMIAEEESLTGVVEYSTHLFKPDTVQRMIYHFIHILRQIVNQPGISLQEIELASQEEKRTLLQNFNRTKLEYPRGKTIQAWFEEQVAKRPEQVAVVYGKEQLSYRELNERANRLAHTLRKKGIGKEQIVGILMPASIDMMTAILGVLKAGAAYLPIDPGYPAERIQYMLEDSRAVLLLTNDQITVPPISTEQWNLNQMVFHDELWHNPAPLNGEHDLAYVIYTSGSTGKPKGVMVEHASLVNLCQWHVKEFEVTPADRCTKYAGVGFDASVWEIFPTWMAGASLYIIEEALRYDLDALNEYMEEKGITIAFLPTQVAEQFMQLENSSLRTLLVGGDRLQRVCPQSYAVVNNYGPTENTVVTTSTEVRTGEPITIGKPIANNQVYVLNEHQQLQPIGVPGELCVSGDSLARGYLHQRELTEEKFVQNPFVPGQRMYRTGDLVRWMPDGSLEFLGRIDDQVKIRGYRVELGEITSRLLSYPAVKEAVVMAQNDDRNQLSLCAYFTASEHCSISGLRQYLGKELPDYMIPAYFMQLEEFPLTANGKVDSGQLPKPKQMETGVKYVAPSSKTEKILAQVWREVLQVDHAGVHDHFFELGGDSIKAMQIASRLKRHHLKLKLKDLFQYPTIQELSLHVQQSIEEGEEKTVAGELALTPIQHWLFEQTDYPDQWNMAIILHRKQGWDTNILKSVFQELVAHHDALRMSFRQEAGQIKAVNRGLAGEYFRLYEFDVNEEENVSARLEKEATRLHRSIRINDGPLIRLGIFHTVKGDYLLMIIHHLVMDAVSWRVLSEDLHSAYQQKLKGKPVVLPLKTTSFRTWSEKLHEYANSPSLLGEIPYWQQTDHEQVPALPVDKWENVDFANKHVEMVWGHLDHEHTHALLSQAHRAYQTQTNDLLLSALVMTLSSWTYGTVAVQLEGHGREEIADGVDLTRTIGWFTSMYPVVFKIGTHNPADVIPYVKEKLRQVPNKGVGYSILKYLTDPRHKQDLHFNLKPEINFNYQGEFVQDVEKEGVEIVNMPIGEGVHPLTKWPYKLDFSVFVQNGELVTLIRYHEPLYYRETIERLKNHYIHQLKRIIDFCREEAHVK